MSTIKRFEESRAWMEARRLVNDVYTLTNQKEVNRDFAFRDQIRRSSLSIMNNISEGFESQTNKTFFSYLSIAKASCGETRSLLYVALDQKYIEKEEFEDLKSRCEHLSTSIHKWMGYLNNSENRNRVSERRPLLQS